MACFCREKHEMVGRLTDWCIRKVFTAAVCCTIAFQSDLYNAVTFNGKHSLAPAFIGFVSKVREGNRRNGTFAVGEGVLKAWIL